MKQVLTLFACSALLMAQSVEILQQLYYYDGSGDLEYVCEARSTQPTIARITVSTASEADPAVFTATAHGFDFQTTATISPLIRITGATGDWAGINGVWAATIVDANSFSIPVDSSMFGAYMGQTPTFETRSPRTTDSVWRVRKYSSGDDGTRAGMWGTAAAGAGSTSLAGPSAAFNQVCANRTSLSYQ